MLLLVYFVMLLITFTFSGANTNLRPLAFVKLHSLQLASIVRLSTANPSILSGVINLIFRPQPSMCVNIVRDYLRYIFG